MSILSSRRVAMVVFLIALLARPDRAVAVSFSGDATASSLGGTTSSTTLAGPESTTGPMSSVGSCSSARAQAWLSVSAGALASATFSNGSPTAGVCGASSDGHTNVAYSDTYVIQSDVLAPGTLVDLYLCVKAAIRHGTSFGCANFINDGVNNSASLSVRFASGAQAQIAQGTYVERWNCYDGHDLTETGLFAPGGGGQTLTLVQVPVGAQVPFYATMSIASSSGSLNNPVEGHIEVAVVVGYSANAPVRLVSFFDSQELSTADNCTDMKLAAWLPPNGGVLAVADAAPGRSIELRPATPNPASGPVAISFRLPRAAAVDLAVYDLAGARIARIAQGWRTDGPHSVTWSGCDDDGRSVRPGCYWLRLVTPEGRASRALVIRR